jgi:hypothetical protein
MSRTPSTLKNAQSWRGLEQELKSEDVAIEGDGALEIGNGYRDLGDAGEVG